MKQTLYLFTALVYFKSNSKGTRMPSTDVALLPLNSDFELYRDLEFSFWIFNMCMPTVGKCIFLQLMFVICYDRIVIKYRSLIQFSSVETACFFCPHPFLKISSRDTIKMCWFCSKTTEWSHWILRGIFTGNLQQN